jgi:O-antigen ligase
MLFFWIKEKYGAFALSEIPLRYLFLLIIIVNIGTLLFSTYFTASLERLLSLLVEEFLFFILIYSSLNNRKDIVSILLIVSVSATIVASHTFLEKYAGINLKAYIPGIGIELYQVVSNEAGRATSMYRHPILLGYGLTMCLSVTILLFDVLSKNYQKIITLFSILILLSAIYFCGSRGPWISLILLILFLFIFGSIALKKRMLFIMLGMMIFFLIKPGVYSTIQNLYRSTFDQNTSKGHSYSYRWLLWEIALSEISKSSLRFLFGYGQDTHQLISRSGSYEMGDRYRTSQFWSWDNEYAKKLVNTGFLGLLSLGILYIYLFIILIRIYKNSNTFDKKIVLNTIMVQVILLFMMTNVSIFDSKIPFLFWINIAIALKLKEIQDREFNFFISNQTYSK